MQKEKRRRDTRLFFLVLFLIAVIFLYSKISNNDTDDLSGYLILNKGATINDVYAGSLKEVFFTRQTDGTKFIDDSDGFDVSRSVTWGTTSGPFPRDPNALNEVISRTESCEGNNVIEGVELKNVKITINTADGGKTFDHINRPYFLVFSYDCSLEGKTCNNGACVNVNQQPYVKEFFSVPSGIGVTAQYDPLSGKAFVFNRKISEVSFTGPAQSAVKTLSDSMVPERVSMGSVRDPRDGKIYLFGGVDPITRSRLSDVYVFDPALGEGAKLLRLSDGLPQALSSTTAVWDNNRNVAYIFGGVNSNGQPTRSAIVFNPDAPVGSKFTLLSDLLPTSAFSLGVVYNPGDGKIYIGGDGRSTITQFNPDAPAGSKFIDYDNLEETLLGSTATYNPSNGKIYFFGGWTGNAFSDRIYEFNPSAPAGSRVRRVASLSSSIAYASSFYEPSTNSIYVVGGGNADIQYNNLVQFDSSNNVRTFGGFPEGFVGAPVVYDTLRRKFYVFDDVIYQFDPQANLDQAVTILQDNFPTPRRASMASFDPNRNVVYLFGGRNPITGQRLNEIYEFNPSSPVGSKLTLLSDILPVGLSSAEAVWDSNRNIVHIIGGVEENGRSTRKIYQFNPSNPEGSKVSQSPDQLITASLPSAAFDQINDKIYIFGDGTDKTYIYNLAAPSSPRISLSDNLPYILGGVGVSLNTQRNKIYIFGGYGDFGRTYSSVIEYDPSKPDGQKITQVAQMLSPRSYPRAVYDPNVDRIYIFGGLRIDAPQGTDIIEYLYYE